MSPFHRQALAYRGDMSRQPFLGQEVLRIDVQVMMTVFAFGSWILWEKNEVGLPGKFFAQGANEGMSVTAFSVVDLSFSVARAGLSKSLVDEILRSHDKFSVTNRRTSPLTKTFHDFLPT